MNESENDRTWQGGDDETDWEAQERIMEYNDWVGNGGWDWEAGRFLPTRTVVVK